MQTVIRVSVTSQRQYLILPQPLAEEAGIQDGDSVRVRSSASLPGRLTLVIERIDDAQTE